jgi:N-methylhydantoinase A
MLDMSRIVVPRDSPVFCAWGLLMADFVMRQGQTVNWTIGQMDELERVNATGDRLAAAAVGAMRDEGFAQDSISVSRTGAIHYAGQVHALSLDLPERLQPDAIPDMSERFVQLYERTYGPGTAWTSMPQRLVNYTVTVTGEMPSPQLDTLQAAPTSREEMLKGEREIYLPTERERRLTPIYDEARFTVGSVIPGPAVIEADDTTIYVPAGVVAERDGFTNIILSEQ